MREVQLDLLHLKREKGRHKRNSVNNYIPTTQLEKEQGPALQ
jgi:hypothetical protein